MKKICKRVLESWLLLNLNLNEIKRLKWKGKQSFENSPNVNLSSKCHAKSALKQNAKDFEQNQAQSREPKTMQSKLSSLISWNWMCRLKLVCEMVWCGAHVKHTLASSEPPFFWRRNLFWTLCPELFLLMTASLCVEQFFKCPLNPRRIKLDCKSDWNRFGSIS